MKKTEHLNLNLPGEHNIADIKDLNENFEKLDGKHKEIDKHIKGKILSEKGMHGFRYWEDKPWIWEDDEWVEMEVGGDILVKDRPPDPKTDLDYEVPTTWFDKNTGNVYCLKGHYSNGTSIWVEYRPDNTLRSVIPIKDLPLGTKIKHPEMKCDNKEVVWMKVSYDGHYDKNQTIFISAENMKGKAFDAMEPNNPTVTRAEEGNNNYALSNIDAWLNSDKRNWYAPKHEYDQKPSSDYVQGQRYDNESGFLYDFSEKAIEALKSTTIDSGKTDLDGGGLIKIKRKIFLMSVIESGLQSNEIHEGKKFPYFTSNANREPGTYWLRTPLQTLPYSVNYMTNDGTLSGYYAKVSHGIRPLTSFSSDSLVDSNQNPDGTYTLIL